MVILALTAKQKQQPSNELQHQEIWKHKIASDKEFSQHFLVKVNFVVEKKPGVTDVRLLDRQPAENPTSSSHGSRSDSLRYLIISRWLRIFLSLLGQLLSCSDQQAVNFISSQPNQ